MLLLIAGALTRDHIQAAGRRWTQPGGTAWHIAAGLAGSSVSQLAVGQAGPWARQFAAPGLGAAGVSWWGPASARDAVFVNRYEGAERRQAVLARPLPLTPADLPPARPEAALISPLYPEAVAPGVAVELARRGAFVALDVQGLLRRVGADRRVRTAPIDLARAIEGAHVIKFSRREFGVVRGGQAERLAAVELADGLGVELLVSRGQAGAIVAVGDQSFAVAARPLEGAVEVTGAGDVLLAGYAYARARGQSPPQALRQASALTDALLARRRITVERAQIEAEVRRLYGLALRTRSLLGRGSGRPAVVTAAMFPPDAPLARALARHLPGPLQVELDDPVQRAAGVVSACWALLARGWPADPELRVEALSTAVGQQRAALARLEAAL